MEPWNIGMFVELADCQFSGCVLPEYARHQLAAGKYVLARFDDVHGPIWRKESDGSEWVMALSDIVSATAKVDGGRSYKPLCKDPVA